MQVVLVFVVEGEDVGGLAGLRRCSFFLGGHQGAGVLHFKNGVLAEVDEDFQFLFVAAFCHARVEERPFRFLQSKIMSLSHQMDGWMDG